MLRNLSFRAKLALVVVPPIAALAALSGVVVAPELRAATEAGHNGDDARLGLSSMQLLHALEEERGQSVRALSSGGRSGTAEIAAQRALSDSRRSAFLAQVAGGGAVTGTRQAAVDAV